MVPMQCSDISPVRRGLAAIAFALVGYASSVLSWHVLFGKAVMANPKLWRTPDAAEMFILPPLGLLFCGVAVTYLYSKFCTCGEGEGSCLYQKSLTLGALLSLVAVGVCTIPFFAYHPISPDLLWASLLDKTLTFMLGTLVVGVVMGRGCGAKKACE